MSRVSSLSRGILLFVLLALLAGCGGKGRPALVPVSGQVLLDGKPLTTGVVRVVPEHGRAATGVIDAEGHFRLTSSEVGYADNDGCIPGTHAVVITARYASGPRKGQWLVPQKWTSAATSPLKVTIDKPTDSLQIEIVSEGPAPK